MGGKLSRTTLGRKFSLKKQNPDMRKSLRKKKQEFIENMKKEQLYMAYSNQE